MPTTTHVVFAYFSWLTKLRDSYDYLVSCESNEILSVSLIKYNTSFTFKTTNGYKNFSIVWFNIFLVFHHNQAGKNFWFDKTKLSWTATSWTLDKKMRSLEFNALYTRSWDIKYKRFRGWVSVERDWNFVFNLKISFIIVLLRLWDILWNMWKYNFSSL